MHMGNELLTPGTGIALIAIAGAGLGYAAKKAKHDLDGEKVPLMGVMGAFIFAGQMINFPILIGTSGHLGGGMLLAILLGPHIAALTMASILIVQCFLFQDGGLLALGANIINLGFVPAYFGTAVYRGIQSISRGTSGNFASVFFSAFCSVVAGALLLPLQVAIAGVYQVPLITFMLIMGGVHSIIGIIEGLITVTVVGFVYKVRPEMTERKGEGHRGLSLIGVSVLLLAVTLIIAGYLSYYASSSPDGLEWAIEKLSPGIPEGENSASIIENKPPQFPAFPDYEVPDQNFQTDHPHLSKGFAGAAGSIVMIILLFAVGGILRRKKDVRSQNTEVGSQKPVVGSQERGNRL